MTTFSPTKEHKRKQVLLHDPTSPEETNNSIPRKKRVAAYARVSTELDSQQNSYEAQIEYYTTYIQNKPEWEFVRVYADEGITGTSYKRRDGFNQMIDDAINGKIDLILTKSISRFARNTVDALTITRQLKSDNIEVFFEKENISSMDAQAELIFTIMSSIAQEESRSISQNVRWGLLRSMEAGKIFLPWGSFLGFEKGPDGLPRIVEEEAEIVRRIYRDYLNGGTLQGIARSLIQDGVKTPCGKERWTAEAVRHILTNEKYKGDAILQKTYTVDFLSKEVRVNNGERKQWYIRDSHDAIVTPETYRLVQTELKRRGGSRGRYFESPFTGNLYCGVCGNFYGHHTRYPVAKLVDEKTGTVLYERAGRGKSVWICNHNNKSGDKEEMKARIPCKACGGLHKGVCGDSGVCKTPMVEDGKIRKAFIVAANRVLSNCAIDWAELERELLATADVPTAERERKVHDLLCRLLDERNIVTRFDEHIWHTLVEYAEVMASGNLIFHFRDGRKEEVSLSEI